jgi:hypothetical protein
MHLNAMQNGFSVTEMRNVALQTFHEKPSYTCMSPRVIRDTNSNDIGTIGVNNTAFRAVLKQQASWNDTIILSSVDSGYVDMAINLYFTSFRKFDIENYLFVGSDSDVCSTLSGFNITCFEYIHDKDGKNASRYGSTAFKRKTHLKTIIILEALLLGLQVLITDVDIVFLKNPLPYLTCYTCDIELSSDGAEGNSGFYLARPTPAAIKLHCEAWNQGLVKPEFSNQKAIDRNMEKMLRNKQINVNNLDRRLYPNGRVYFEKGKRMFKGDNPCTNCIIVHNNWIISSAAKVYRFKECGLWKNNRNDYYSNLMNKYISFELPKDYGANHTKSAEINALQNALIIGAVLGRIVILPEFHCYRCKYHPACTQTNSKCTLGVFYKIEAFDSQLSGKYRESVFLSHDKVPKAVKDSSSSLHFLDTRLNREAFPGSVTNVIKLAPKDAGGATVNELTQWFGNMTTSILRFHSLYHGVDRTRPNVANIIKKIQRAFRESDYRQYTG